MLWERKIKAALNPLDLTHTQYVILAVIEELTERGQLVNQKAISDFSHIDVMTISKSIRLLENKKLICRIESKIDTRAKVVKNTQQGVALLQEAVNAVEAVDVSFFCMNSKEKNGNFTIALQELQERNA